MRSCACAQPAPNHMPARDLAEMLGTPYEFLLITAASAPRPTRSTDVAPEAPVVRVAAVRSADAAVGSRMAPTASTAAVPMISDRPPTAGFLDTELTSAFAPRRGRCRPVGARLTRRSRFPGDGPAGNLRRLVI